MSIADIVLGRPLASAEDSQERIGPLRGVPIFGLDALGSAAYGPEAALTLLIPLGMAGLSYILPISGAVILLLIIVYFSYRQTIAAYPNGGGSYTVAKENLGKHAGLLGGAALMVDYVLNVAVGISAGVGALVSAAPSLQPYTLTLCLGILALLTVINLRGVREAGIAFMAPTYLFVGCLFTVLGWGIYKTIAAGGHPHAVVAAHALPATQAAVSAWLILKAFSSGCTAMTGVEAVSNGVQSFQEPVVPAARRTLTAIILILIALLAGIAYLTHAYQIGATEPGKQGYESVLSQLTGAVVGKGVFYYVTIGSILLVLSLSANTSFAGFPLLCRVVADDGYLPRSFSNRGRRLVFTEGIFVLLALSGGLLMLFGGVTDRLIPLFAIGALLAFTLSQAGMVAHWKREGGDHSRASMAINGLGAAATGATALIVLAAKFTEGAWVIVVLIPCLLVLMTGIRRHYDRVALQVDAQEPLPCEDLCPPIVIVPIEKWNKVTQRALRFAMSISPDVEVVHIECGEETEKLRQHWNEQIEQPAHKANRQPPRLTVLESPFRAITQPIIEHVFKTECDHPDKPIGVLVPELVEYHWYHYFLHNQRAEILKAMLLTKGKGQIVLINVPWYLRA